MAKRTNGTLPAGDTVATSSGGEEQGTENLTLDVVVERTDKERMERVLLHLSYMTEDLQALIQPRGTANTLIRQEAAKCQCQIVGNAETWTPIALLKKVMGAAQKRMK